MSEETPLFKFKKASTKKIGDFDVLDNSEWTLLIKPQIQDVTLFVHFRKLWNITEEPEVLDADGNVEKKAVKQHPAYEFRSGFIKEDKFIIQNNRMVSEQTYHAIQKRYVLNLTNLIEQGYQKDWNNYNLDEPIVPHYYINERMSQEEAMMQQIVAQAKSQRPHLMLNQPQIVQSGNNQVQVSPGGSTNPVTKKKQFNFLRLKPQQAVAAVEDKDEE